MFSRKDADGFLLPPHHRNALSSTNIISEKELKDRFQKWGVGKYISDQDMSIMLSMKKDYEATGKHPRFQYKGHEIYQGRIERASKRRKEPLASPTSEVLPYLKT